MAFPKSIYMQVYVLCCLPILLITANRWLLTWWKRIPSN